MSRIAFIQDILHEHTGTMILSACLKARGHSCDVFIESGERDIVGALRKFAPDLIAFSCLTGGHRWALKMAAELRPIFNIPVIFGGVHPTLFPQILSHDQVDMVCIGEGEDTLAELADDLPDLKNIDQIKGIHYKRNGSIFKTQPRTLTMHLSDIPMTDRSIYLKYSALERNPSKHFMAGRGCPYSCTFCYNDSLKKIYGEGRYMRLRTPDHMIAELKYVKSSTVLRTVVFDDDTFTADKRWLKDFLAAYKVEIGLPYICNVRVEHINDDTAAMLADSGCFRVCMGVECGSEMLRRTVLGKKFTNDDIVKAATIIKSHGIKILTNNMMGVPDETLDDAFETIKINIRIGTDYPWCSVFQPYPGTPLAVYAADKGYISSLDPDDFEATFFEGSMLKMNEINEIVNLQKFFYIAVRFPWTIPLIKKAVRWPLRRLYHFIFLVFFAYRYAASNRLGLKDIARFGVSALSLYRRPLPK